MQRSRWLFSCSFWLFARRSASIAQCDQAAALIEIANPVIAAASEAEGGSSAGPICFRPATR